MKWITLSILLLSTAVAQADVPAAMSYQGIVTDSNGQPLEGNYTFTFKIYDTADQGVTTSLWEESQVVSVESGVYSVILGSSTPLTLPFNVTYFLGITIAGDDEMSPRIELTSSPYALMAHDADFLDGLDATELAAADHSHPMDDLSDVVASAPSENDVLIYQGSAWTAAPPAAVPDADWEIASGNVYRMTGNVGIGTDSPDDPWVPLVVRRDHELPTLIEIENRHSGSGSGVGVRFTDEEGEAGVSITDGTSPDGRTMAFFDTNPDSRFRFWTHQVDVDGTLHANSIITDAFRMSTGAGSGYVLTSNGVGIGTWAAHAHAMDDLSDVAAPTPSENDVLVYQSGEWSAAPPAAAPDADWEILSGNVYRASGNVGIGEAVPTSPLVIRRDQPGETIIVLENHDPTSSSREGIRFNDENGGLAGILTTDDDVSGGSVMGFFNNRPTGYFQFTTGGTEKVRISNDGRVGIGVAPTTKLDVDGTIKATGFRMPLGASEDYVLTADGIGNASWQKAGLALPYSGSWDGPENAFAVTNTDASGGAVLATNSGSGTRATLGSPWYAVHGEGVDGYAAVFGENTNGPGVKGDTQSGWGVYGQSDTGRGVFGWASESGYGVVGQSDDGTGVYGLNALSATTAELATNDVAGLFSSPLDGVDVHVLESEYTGTGTYDAVAVYGKSEPTDYYGIGGQFYGGYKGVEGRVNATGSSSYYGVRGRVGGGSGSSYGVRGSVDSGSGTNYGVYGSASGTGTNWAGYFYGDVRVTGTLDNSLPMSRIDHPLDPENQYLTHYSVGSSEIKNVYDGTVILDGAGEAWVEFPEWFDALNAEYRYQLTAIGTPSPGIFIAEEISSGRFKIAGGAPGSKVCWLVTGVRQDPYAQAQVRPVESYKPAGERGYYRNAAAYGALEEQSIDGARDAKERSLKGLD